MKHHEFENLRIGDIVHLRGKDRNKDAEVVFIKYDEVVIECLDPEGFTIGSKTNSKLYVTNYKNLYLHLQ